MKYRYVGRSGLLVSRLCLGTINIGDRVLVPEKKDGIQLVRNYLEGGGNFLDTADFYNGGESERVLGESLQGVDRDDVVIASKCFFRTRDAPTAKGLSRKHIVEACEASLKRLSIEYLDLYNIHGPDPHTPIEETLEAMTQLVRQGKVRYIGSSNLYAWQLMKAAHAAELRRAEHFIVNQALYNLLVRDIEEEIIPASRELGIGVTCWSPLAAGMLTGRYKRSQEPELGSRLKNSEKYSVARYWNENGFTIVDVLLEVATEVGKTPSQVALGWLLSRREVSSVIMGVSRQSQLEDNMAVGDWNLPIDLAKRLDVASAPHRRYPGDWIEMVHPENFGEEEFL